MTSQNQVRISDILSPAFYDVFSEAACGSTGELVMKGGRGSTKSSAASLIAVYRMVQDPMAHVLVMRKVGATLRNSVYQQYRWAIDILGLSHLCRATTMPMEITILHTGQKILFFGADDPSKLKSLKLPFGYIDVLHLEELDQFTGEAEVRNIEQSAMRGAYPGGHMPLVLKSFNPPRTRNSWANRYCERQKPGQTIHSSTYLTTPPRWLGKKFLDDAEYLKATDPGAYEHEYLGKANFTGGLVFENVRAQAIPDEQVQTFDRILNGVDWGWYPDPWAFNRCHYDAARRTLYIFHEQRANKRDNAQTAALVKKAIGAEVVVCDSAEPKSVSDYRAFGLSARTAEKGPGSVVYSYKWLQGLAAIVIDPQRCPYSLEEFGLAEYERDKQGEPISNAFVDRDNHHIDAVRYATERVWRRRGR